MFQSASIKLTLWYVAIIMSLSLLFSLGLFRIQNDNLTRGLERQGAQIWQLPPSGDSNPLTMPQLRQSRQTIIAEANQALIRNLIFINSGVLLASAGLGYMLARRTLRPIQDMVEEQSRFTSDASHELRTPLTAIKTEIEVSLRAKHIDDKTARHILNSNREEVDKLALLSDRLLALSRYEQLPQSTFQPQPLHHLVQQAIDQLSPLIQAKHHQLQLNLSPVTVMGQSANLRELVIILVENAIKYTPEHGHILVEVALVGHKARLLVSDTGIGIRAVDLPHIFDRFFRADSSRARQQASGYGLGLSIAKTIVNRHKGTLTVTSVPDQGSTFTVLMPAFKSSASNTSSS